MNRKRSSSISSADIIFGNGDLLTEILVFVPAKSLVRLQLVNKNWHSIISSKPFRHLHTLHHRHRPTPQPSFLVREILVFDDGKYFICHPTNKRLLPFHFEFGFTRILQSCNGLLLLECRTTRYGRKAYYVFNPTTMRSRNLFIEDLVSGLRLLFDPSKSPYYIVVCFKCKESFTHVLVYDSEFHKWKEGGIFQKGPKMFRDGIYWNGGIFFIRSRRNSCCFFLGDEKIRSITDPPRSTHNYYHDNYYIMESNGHLHWIMDSAKQLHVYEFGMNDEQSSWFFKYYVDLTPILSTSSSKRAICSLLGMIRGEREEDSVLLIHVPGKMMIYKFLDKSFEVVVDFREESNYEDGLLLFDHMDAHAFIETLAPV